MSAAASGALPPPRVGLSRRRRAIGAVVAVLGPVMLTAVLLPMRAALSLPSQLLLYLLVVVAVALVGGTAPAVLAAVAATLLANWYFTPPYGTFFVEGRDQVIALLVFVVVAVAVSAAVEIAGRLAGLAARSEAETRLVSDLAGGALEDSALPDVLDRLRATFGFDRVTLQERDDDAGWHDAARSADSGTAAGDELAERVIDVPGHAQLRLLAIGPPLFAEDNRVLGAFATAAAAALDRQRLAEQAADAEQLAATDRMRTALLASVGHDLRTPLAAIKAAASSLRQPDIAWTREQQAELHATIEESADQLSLLVANLLDMSRLHAGVVHVAAHQVGLDDVVAAALRTLPAHELAHAVQVDVADDLPAVSTDPGLLERVIANVVSNAVRHGAGARPVRIEADAGSDTVALRVVDAGPGVPPAERDRVFTAFQRLDDHGRGTGVGLGLAVARGLADAVGATLHASDTPGGGLTMTVTVPRAAVDEAPRQAVR